MSFDLNIKNNRHKISYDSLNSSSGLNYDEMKSNSEFSSSITEESTLAGDFNDLEKGKLVNRKISTTKVHKVNRFSTFYKLFKLNLIKLQHHLNIRILKKCLILLFLILVVYKFVFVRFFSRVNPPKKWDYLEPRKKVSAKNLVDLLSLNDNQLRGLELNKSKLPSKLNNSAYYNSYQIFDPRLVVSLYLNKIKQHLKISGQLSKDFELSFHWRDWINFDERLLPNNNYQNLNNGNSIQSCESFLIENGFNLRYNDNTLINCTDLNTFEISNLKSSLYPYFKINEPVDVPLPLNTRIVIGSTYLYHNFNPPDRVIFVDGLENKQIKIKVDMSGEDENSILDSLIQDYKIENPDKIDISINEELRKLNNEVLRFDTDFVDSSVEVEDSRIIRLKPRLSPVTLDKYNFEQIGIETFEASFADLNKKENFDSLEYKLLKNINEIIQEYPKSEYPKYFHESPTNDQKFGGSHYDWRFINLCRLPTDFERKSSLHKLIRGWLRFSKSIKLKSWISHGSLLGYQFNGLSLPWDFDHDIQITFKSMRKLMKFYNKSVIVDVTPQDEMNDFDNSGMGQFYLDISSNFFDRSKGNGNNTIDGRFIDIHTGFYIDITVLSEVKNEIDVKKIDSDLKPEYFNMLKQYDGKLDLNDEDEENLIVSCKNDHYYKLKELSPLISTNFEGVNGLIPQDFLKILQREFEKYKKNLNYEEYTWRSFLNLWIADADCDKKDLIGETCLSDDLINVTYNLQKTYIENHLKEMSIFKNTGINEKYFNREAELEEYPKLLQYDDQLIKLAISRI